MARVLRSAHVMKHALIFVTLAHAMMGCALDLEPKCSPLTFKPSCQGDVIRQCTWGTHSGPASAVQLFDCSATGQTCVLSPDGNEAACVDRSLDSCTDTGVTCSADGSAVQTCRFKFVHSTPCDAGTRCVDTRKGYGTCETLANVACSGSKTLCSADRRLSLFCHKGQAYQLASCGDGAVCVEAGDKAACVVDKLIACDATSPETICGADHAMLSCNLDVGFYATRLLCGESCVAGPNGAACSSRTRSRP